jgi:hypothetical protein
MAIMFGMSTQEFWKEDPDLLWTYRKVYTDKFKVQREISNQTAWINGMYVYKALNVALYNSFKKKEEALAEYPDKPYELDSGKTEEEIEQEKIKKDEDTIRNNLKKAMQLLKK